MKRRSILSLAAWAAVANSARAQAAPPGAPSAPPPGMPPGFPNMGPPPEIIAAVDVQGSSVTQPAAAGARVQAARLDARGARALKLQSSRDKVNGLYVHGAARFELQGADIETSGRSSSDFDGVAAAVLAKDQAQLTLRHARVVTRGVAAAAVTATDGSTLHVHHSDLQAWGGPLPSGYVRRIGPGMLEPPTPLGIVGTARTTLAMGSAKAYYHDSRITAEGWGALSTDAARGAYLEVNRCTVRVLKSGYGTYADNGATVVINDSLLDVPTFGGVIAGQASLALNRTRIKSAGNAVMIHSVMGQPAEVATLTIDGGDIQTRDAAIVVKSANADIRIRGAKISARNGDLLLGVVNDDGFATKVGGQAVAGIKATIAASRLEGNLVHLDTERAMTVTLQGSTLQGRVQGATLGLDAASRWRATADSTVTIQGALLPGQLDAPAGVTIRAKNGAGSALSGRQVLAGGGVLVVE